MRVFGASSMEFQATFMTVMRNAVDLCINDSSCGGGAPRADEMSSLVGVDGFNLCMYICTNVRK